MAAVLLLGGDLAAGTTVPAAWDGILLRVEGIQGEVARPDYEGWIRVESFTQAWNLAAAPAVQTQATGAGGALSVSTIGFLKEVDRASPKLAEAVCKGRVFPRVRFEFLRRDQQVVRYFQVLLENVLFVSHQTVMDAGQARPEESLTIVFEKATWAYTEFDTKGDAWADYRTIWDFVKGQGGTTARRFGLRTVAEPKRDRSGIRLRWTALAGKRYRVLRSDLINGTFTPVSADLPVGAGQREVELPFSGRYGFYLISEVPDVPGQP